ncbi:MAG: tyrosine-protein phosphatase [Gammaproteobacteria bacterium]
MIDLHCHLLPGIDDGPKTREDALELCRTAVSNGITRAVATPHITPGRYDNTFESITVVYNSFCEDLLEAGIALQLGMAAEVRLDPVIMDMVQSGSVPFLGEYDGEKLILLEFPHTHIPPGSSELIKWLLDQGIRPLIAHPERNGDVLRKLGKIEPFVKVGCLLQITAGSLAGVFGDLPRKRGIEMLKNDWVLIMASDAHNMHARLPDIEPGRAVAAAIVGEQQSWELVRERPLAISKFHFEHAH